MVLNYDNPITRAAAKEANGKVVFFSSKSKLDDNVIVFDKSKFSTLDMIKVCDYVITDYSAVCIEASLLNKPVYFYLYD